METKYTPGPWVVTGSGAGYNVQGGHPKGHLYVAFASSSDYRDAEESLANARLIAAAPELLAALEELVGEFDNDSYAAEREQGCMGLNETGGIIQARAVIAKARGGADA